MALLPVSPEVEITGSAKAKTSEAIINILAANIKRCFSTERCLVEFFKFCKNLTSLKYTVL